MNLTGHMAFSFSEHGMVGWTSSSDQYGTEGRVWLVRQCSTHVSNVNTASYNVIIRHTVLLILNLSFK